MRFSLSLLLTLILIGSELSLAAQEKNVPEEIVSFRLSQHSEIPEYGRFRPDFSLEKDDFNQWLYRTFNWNTDFGLVGVSQESDHLGYVHYRMQQTYRGVPIEHAIVILHTRGNQVRSFNGLLYDDLDPGQELWSIDQARDKAINYVVADVFKWELPEEEEHLKWETGDPNASYYPFGKKTIVGKQASLDAEMLEQAYVFNIYSHQPVHRSLVYVSAVTGEVIFDNHLLCSVDSAGTAHTVYSGTHPITTDWTGSVFRLRESGRGNGIETYDMNNGTSYAAAVDFVDSNNIWNNVNAQLDEYATDAHWGAEKTYDYFFNKFGRNSIDNNGFKIRSYIHYGTNYVNAFWDGQRMTYGDGNATYSPLVSTDICAHEITHGLTNFTANLIYQNESGALNESFSDIFGAAVEFYANNGAGDWLMGEDIGNAFRSLSNPNIKADPDTYLGLHWYTGTGDNGGVHTNSGVQNYWFYLLTEGGSGINDHGDTFLVNGVGLDTAAAIAFRNLTVYMTPGSQYEDARFYAIQSAIDLYGACSDPVVATANAWYAVGVGEPFDTSVLASFTSSDTAGCAAPFSVQFSNLSQNAESFFWDFGDGDTSVQFSPTHIYQSDGLYDVQLIVDGGNCGLDTMFRTNYISVDDVNPCVTYLPGLDPTSCQGIMYDMGGPNADYFDNTDTSITIAPVGASQVTLQFTAFDYENGYDYLYIYDGPNTSSPLIGQYDGQALPNGGTIVSTGGSITLRHFSDAFVTGDGFALNWSCFIPNHPPLAQFSLNYSACSGNFSAIDQSLHQPTSWLWDFGDGTTSTMQNPEHEYTQDGVYNVTLIATNAFGSDTLVKENHVTIDLTDPPSTMGDSSCVPDSLTLTASAIGGEIFWYDSLTGGSVLDTGEIFTTPYLTQSATFYAQEIFDHPAVFGGPLDNSIGSGGNFNGDRDLIFDAHQKVIIKSVKSYANGTGNRTVELKASDGTILHSESVYFPDGENRIVLNITVNPGTGYRLGCTSNANLYRNSSGASFPYLIDTLVSITGTDATASGFYYFFYDWEVDVPTCKSERVAVQADILDNPTVNILSQDTACVGDNVLLLAQGSFIDSLYWPQFATSNDSVWHQSMEDSQYVVMAFNSCGIDSSIKNLQVEDYPSITTSNDTLICDGQSAQLQANSNINNYAWNPGGSSANTILVAPNTSTYYHVSSQNFCGIDEDSVFVDVTFTPFIQASVDTTICSGNQAVLQASSNVPASFVWTPGNLSSDSITIQPDSSITYTVVGQNQCGSDNRTVVVTVNHPPTPIQQNDTAICNGEMVTLSVAIGATSYSWSTNDTTQQLNLQPSQSTLVIGGASNLCGMLVDSVLVMVNQEPEIDLLGDSTICDGVLGVYQVVSTNTDSLWWPQVMSNDTSISYQINQNDAILVWAFNQCGTTVDSLSVFLAPVPTITASSDTSVCEGSQIWLSTQNTHADLVIWPITQDTATSISITPQTDLQFPVFALNECGVAYDTVVVTVAHLPSFVPLSDTTVCNNDSTQIQLSVTDANTVIWNGGVVSTSHIVAFADSSGWNHVSYLNGCGVVADTFLLTAGITPSAELFADSAACEGDTIHITGQANVQGSFEWSFTSSTSPSQMLEIQSSQVLTLYVSNECGTDTVDHYVSMLNAPSILLSPDTSICKDEIPLLITASSQHADSIQWYPNLPSGNAISVSPSASTFYWAEAHGVCGIAEDTIWVDVIGNPTANFTTQIGGNGQVNMTNTSSDFQTTHWDFGDGTTSTDVNGSHQYSTSDVYNVTLVVESECGADTMEQLVDVVLSISDVDYRGLQLFPNPSSEKLTITTVGDFSISELGVLDMLGREVASEYLSSPLTNTVVDVSNISEGEYILVITSSDEKRYYQRFQVMRD